MKKDTLIIIVGMLPLFIFPIDASAYHIFEDSQAFGQYLDIAQLMSPKYTLEIDEHSYDIYYGFHASLEIDIESLDEPVPVVSSMGINHERKSLEIYFSEVPLDSVFWVRIPFDVMTAENNQYQLLIDGKKTGYDSTKFPSDYSVGMILPKDSKHIEIIGTTIIPEFGSLTIAVLGITIFATLFAFRGNSRLFNYK